MKGCFAVVMTLRIIFAVAIDASTDQIKKRPINMQIRLDLDGE